MTTESFDKKFHISYEQAKEMGWMGGETEEDIEFDLLAKRIKGREAMKELQCAKVNTSDEISQHIIDINELIKHGNALRMLSEESPQAKSWADCVAKVKGRSNEKL